MKRTRAQQPKVEDPQDAATTAGNAKPQQQRRAKQPRLPKAAAGAGKKQPTAATARAAAAAAAAAAANTASAAASSPGAEAAPTVPDVCAGVAVGSADAEAHALDWDLDDYAGMNAAAAWWTWGVDEEKLLGWFPFVEEDFRCAGGRGGDAEVAAFDDDIWSIW